MADIGYSEAVQLIDAAMRRAEEINCPVSIAVVDTGRELVAFGRQPGAPLLSAEVSQAKAFTARSMNMPTDELGKLSQPGGPLYGLETSHSRTIVTFGGGFPIEIDGTIVGAIGVAGGAVEQDMDIARHALTQVPVAHG